MTGILVYLAGSLLIGAAACFFGKKLFFPLITVLTFLAAFFISASKFGMTLKGFLIALAVGIVAMVLIKFFYKLGVFLAGMLGGAMLGLLISSFLPATVIKYQWIIVLAFALLIGILAIRWNALFLMLSTAYSGASLLAVPLCFLVLEFKNLRSFIYADGFSGTILHLNEYLMHDFLMQNTTIILIVTLLLTAAGFILQKKFDSVK